MRHKVQKRLEAKIKVKATERGKIATIVRGKGEVKAFARIALVTAAGFRRKNRDFFNEVMLCSE